MIALIRNGPMLTPHVLLYVLGHALMPMTDLREGPKWNNNMCWPYAYELADSMNALKGQVNVDHTCVGPMLNMSVVFKYCPKGGVKVKSDMC